MRRILFFIIALSFFSAASALCEYDAGLYNWTGKSSINFNQWDLPTDGFGNPVYIGTNITAIYVALGEDHLYFNFEISDEEQLNDSFVYIMRLYPRTGDVNYFDFYMKCGDVIGLLEKPNTGAAINWTVNANWSTIKQDFEISAHQNSIELAIALKFFGRMYNSEMDLHMEIYSDTTKVNDVWTSGAFDICSKTGFICGNSICEENEIYAASPCACPSDCPDMDMTCYNSYCGNVNCEEGEGTLGSLCECLNDCPIIGELCEITDPITDWSGATTLITSTYKPGQTVNGTDIVALKAKVDSQNMYLKIDLDTDETPHENVTYTIKFYPQKNNIEYITLKLRCSNLYELMEKNNQYQTPTNYTSNPTWPDIKNHFNISATEHAVEITIPWFLIYYADGTYMEVRSNYGSNEVKFLSINLDNIVSLFVSNCGDATCTAEESDPNNRYQYCEQDCPGAQQPPCGNNICDIGEEDRWGSLQCVDDCADTFGLVDGGETKDSTQKFMENIGPIIGIILSLTVIAAGIWTGGKRLYKKATSGMRKLQVLEQRTLEIEQEMKELQKKYLQTAISEAEFRERMETLEREQQNLHLQIKQMKKKK